MPGLLCLWGRKRGAPIGNKNALKHGRYTAAGRAGRLAALKERQVAFKEQQRRSDEWIKTVPVTDYDAICDELRALRRAKETAINVQLAE